MKYLIFSDLDGTLLDHHTYSVQIAKKALAALYLRNIPVVFCSSKTFQEQFFLQKKLKYDVPFIIENGSAIVYSNKYFDIEPANSVRLSDTHNLLPLADKDINYIYSVLKKIKCKSDAKFYGITEASNEEIAVATGLKGAAIKRAKQRWYTNTLLSSLPDQNDIDALENHGLCLSQGGRFLTIQDKTIDKGKAVRMVVQFFATQWKNIPLTIGIGDSLNDIPMLTVVDKPFLVQKPDKTWADVKLDGLTKINKPGPEGFLEMASLLLSDGIV